MPRRPQFLWNSWAESMGMDRVPAELSPEGPEGLQSALHGCLFG